MEYFIGADIGGTSTKVALFDNTGQLLDHVQGEGGNFRTMPAEAFNNIELTLSALLARNESCSITAGHFGVAGAGSARFQAIDAACQKLWSQTGLTAPLTVSSDLEIAYAAGSSDDGLLLLAGTGAVACAFQSGQLIGRGDGLGWILGDIGAGLWIGKSALEAAARDLDRRGPTTALTQLVLDHYGIDPHSADPRQTLIAHVYDQAPSNYGSLAPLVSSAFNAGDKVAREILEHSADSLLETLQAALKEGLESTRTAGNAFEPVSLVLAGSLLTTATPTRTMVLERLESSPIFRTLQLHEPKAPIYGAYHYAVQNNK